VKCGTKKLQLFLNKKIKQFQLEPELEEEEVPLDSESKSEREIPLPDDVPQIVDETHKIHLHHKIYKTI
jgi:hypothetical protein